MIYLLSHSSKDKIKAKKNSVVILQTRKPGPQTPEMLQRRGRQYDGPLENYNPVYHMPAIPLLDIYPQEMKAGAQRDICPHMCIAALFTIANGWKQSKCPSVGE